MINLTNFLTLNVSGLQSKQKRQNIFHWLRSKNADLVFLQETHCGSDKEKRNWREEWDGHSFWSTFSTNSLGVAILVRNKSEIEIQNEQVDVNGRWIKADVKIKDKWIRN